MPCYKLTYFDAKGGAELARLVFAEAGVDYKDIRYDQETWLRYKEQTPFGQIPVLEVDGKILAQSLTIARFLANSFGLAGSNDWDKAQVDSYIDAMTDIWVKCVAILFEKDEKKKAALLETFKGAWAKSMEPFEKALEKNNTNGFLVGSTVTWADLRFLDFADKMACFAWVSLDGLPLCKKLERRISERPKIKAWLESRPKTQY